MHNYCMNTRLDLQEDLEFRTDLIEAIPKTASFFSLVNQYGAPVEKCKGNESVKTVLSQQGRL